MSQALKEYAYESWAKHQSNAPKVAALTGKFYLPLAPTLADPYGMGGYVVSIRPLTEIEIAQAKEAAF